MKLLDHSHKLAGYDYIMWQILEPHFQKATDVFTVKYIKCYRKLHIVAAVTLKYVRTTMCKSTNDNTWSNRNKTLSHFIKNKDVHDRNQVKKMHNFFLQVNFIVKKNWLKIMHCNYVKLHLTTQPLLKPLAACIKYDSAKPKWGGRVMHKPTPVLALSLCIICFWKARTISFLPVPEGNWTENS